MRRIAFAGLWLLVFGIAWENAVMLAGIGTACRVAGVVALFVAVLCVISTGRFRRPGAAHGLMLLFVLWGTVSYFWTVDQELTQDRMWTFLQLFLMAWLIWELARGREEQRSLMQAYVLGCCIAAVDTFVGLATGRVVDVYRYTATNANPNELGILLSLGIPMALYLCIRQRGPFAWANRLYVVTAVVAVFLTSSRTALLTTVAALLFVPWSMGKLSLRQRSVTVLLLVVTAIAAMQYVPEVSWERLATSGAEIRGGTLTHRTQIWHAGWQVYREHPIIGVGAGAYPTAIQPIYGLAKVAHSTFLSTLVEQGVVGFLIFASLLVLLILGVWRLPPLPRRLWAVLLLTWTVGVSVGTWEYKKATWFLLALLAAQAAAYARAKLLDAELHEFEVTEFEPAAQCAKS